MKAVRFVALTLTVFLLLGAACGCSGDIKPVEPTEEESRTVMTCGEFEVPYELFRYFFLNFKLQMDEGDESVWTAPGNAELRERLNASVMASVSEIYTILTLCAEYGIEIDERAIQDEVQAQIEQKIADENGGSFSDYLAELEEANITDSCFRFLLGCQVCEDELYYVMTDSGKIDSDDQTALDYIKSDNFVRIVQILIQNDAGDSDDANRRLAADVLGKAKSGANFDDLIGKYSEDYAMTRDGYYFTYLEMLEPVEKAAFALKPGEISEVIETYVGFHIIKRLEKEDAYILKNYETLKAQYLSSYFYSYIESAKAGVDIVTNEYFDTLTIETVR